MRRSTAYRVFLTRNSEYHIQAGACIGVRDRRSGAWIADHVALGQRLADTYADESGRVRASTLPVIGEPLTFVVAGQAFTTSAVLSIESRDGWPAGVNGFERVLSRRPQACPRQTY